jgi:hypothetical protein
MLKCLCFQGRLAAAQGLRGTIRRIEEAKEMFVQSVLPIINQQVLANMLIGWFSAWAPPLLTNGYVRLFKAYTKAPNPESVVGDFTEASFAGYVQGVFTPPMTGPISLPGENGLQMHFQVDFAADTGIVAPGETILGYYVSDTITLGNILIAELFPTPVPIVLAYDAISLDVCFPGLYAVPTGN